MMRRWGLLRETLSDAGDLDELADLLTARLTKRPGDVEMLLQLAEVKARQEDNYDAIRYYERARLAGARDAPELLNSLAAAYLAEGRGGKARELLQRSLELDPEQPGAAAMLERIGDGL